VLVAERGRIWKGKRSKKVAEQLEQRAAVVALARAPEVAICRRIGRFLTLLTERRGEHLAARAATSRPATARRPPAPGLLISPSFF